MAHPYYPPDLQINNYIANSLSTNTLLAWVTATVVIWFTTMYLISGTAVHMKPGKDRLIFCWFSLCALTHCCFEVYWVYFNKTVASRTDFLAELWREYAHSDSRYLVSDPLVLTLEIMTVTIIGPLCVLAMVALYRNSPSRHLYQLIISVFHIFSCSLYYILDSFKGFSSCDPHPIYFWVYFVGFNSPWIIVPALLIYDSCICIYKATARYRVRWERPIKEK
ncbi:Emopamil-binding protein [Umbelopsis sp. AD052]|nr:Emopamil-binding protein [Umbelopsis sp. AD052]